MFARATFSFAVLACVLAVGAQMPKSAKDRHEYHLMNVRWDISFNFDDASIVGDVTNTVSPNDDGAALYFDCGKLKITSVDVDGTAATTDYDGKVLLVHPAQAIHKGKAVAVRIRYTGKPEAGIYFVPAARAFPAHTPIVYTQGEMEDNRYWLPTYDDPDDKATSEGTIHVPSGWKALSNGRLVEVKHEGATDVWHWKMDQPHSTYLISMVAGPYDEVPDGTMPVPVSFWVPVGLDDWGEQAFGGTDKIVQFYGKLTGVTFPWAKYSQSAVADFMFGGMENVTCTTQTISALHPKRVSDTDDTTGLVAHELAHQWFGDLVTTRDWSHIWLNEGWASFLPCLWDRAKYGEEAYDLDRLNQFDGGLSAHHFEPGRPMIWTHYELPIDMFDGYAYSGGAARMFMLMHIVGEKRFWSGITNYLNEFKFKNATTEDFFNSMSKSLNMDLDEFRRQWFYTPAAPSLTVTHDNGSTFIQQGPTPFHVPLDYWLLGLDGKIEKRHVDLQAVAQTEIPNVDGRTVILDPEAWLMADFGDVEQKPKDWARIYAVLPNAAAKARIIDSHFENLPLDAKLSLAKSEHSPRLLERMIGHIHDTDYLVGMTQDSNANVQLAATRQLGGVPKSDASVARLRDIWSTSDNDLIREAALESLLSLTKDAALAEEAFKTDSFNDDLRTQALNWWAQDDPNKARELSLQILLATPTTASEPLQLSAIRVLGQVKDLPGEHRAYEVLVNILSERSNSPLRAAIGALADYGNKDAIPLIEARADHSLHFVRRDVQSALERLRKE